jgi:acyl-CoA thioester hydrolase
VTDITAASMTLRYELKDETQLYVRASSVLVPYNLEQQRPRRITPEEKAFLEQYRDDGAVAV